MCDIDDSASRKEDNCRRDHKADGINRKKDGVGHKVTYNARGTLITYQASFVGLDKKISNPIGLLHFLSRVDKKDANLKMAKILLYQWFSAFYKMFFNFFRAWRAIREN